MNDNKKIKNKGVEELVREHQELLNRIVNIGLLKDKFTSSPLSPKDASEVLKDLEDYFTNQKLEPEIWVDNGGEGNEISVLLCKWMLSPRKSEWAVQEQEEINKISSFWATPSNSSSVLTEKIRITRKHRDLFNEEEWKEINNRLDNIEVRIKTERGKFKKETSPFTRVNIID